MPPEDFPDPLLRAPPFPGVSGICSLGGTGRAAGEPDEVETALAAMRAARVGGAWWSAVDPWTADARGPVGDERVLIAYLSGRAALDADGRPHARAALDRAVRVRLAGRAWRNPFTGGPATLAQAVGWSAEWRRVLDANRRIGAATGMAAWKRDAIARFLWDGTGSPPFEAPDRAVATARARGRAVAAWPSRVPAGYGANEAVAWVEDGFLRGEGLGADCRAPASVAVDFGAPYYDPAGPSDLERLLAEHPFPPALLARAAALRERIVALRLGKYGTSRGPGSRLPGGRRVVLAVGQVADDLSVRRGGAGVAGMPDFLARVRGAEPDAWIVYRPHPDVLAGHRAGHLADAELRGVADQVDGGTDLLALVERADAVHVLSSLTGFEALLRHRPVVVHGQPFFAGWGLTHDLASPLPRRGRRLSLDALVAATLILYPRYLDPVSGLPCPPETLVDRIAAGEAAADTWLTAVRRAQGRVRRGLTLARGALR
jgi:capsular polysaccharide export protein